MNMKGYKINLIEKPSHNLEVFTQERLVNDLTQIARSAFGSDMDVDDVRKHVLPVDKIYLVQKDGKLVGFSTYDHLLFGDMSVLYCNGTSLLPEDQGKGIAREVRRTAIKQGIEDKIDFVAGRTQGRRMFGLMVSLTEELGIPFYPNLLPNDLPRDIRSVGELMSDYLGGNDYEPSNLIIRSAYGASLYGSNPSHRNADLLFRNLNINETNGDAIIFIGDLREENNGLNKELKNGR